MAVVVSAMTAAAEVLSLFNSFLSFLSFLFRPLQYISFSSLSLLHPRYDLCIGGFDDVGIDIVGYDDDANNRSDDFVGGEIDVERIFAILPFSLLLFSILGRISRVRVPLMI